MPALFPTIPPSLTPSHPFPNGDWSPQYRNRTTPLNNILPAAWEDGLVLPSYPFPNEEVTLRGYIPQQRATHAHEIYSQAVNFMRSIWPVLDAFGNLHVPAPKLKTIELLTLLADTLMAPIFQLKTQINRGRPWHEFQNFDPMVGFKKNETFYPGHPAYPSGHATVAHAVALVLSEIAPIAPGKDPIQAAADVATNREIAGLHFPSDSEAGRVLAKHLFYLFKLDSDVENLMADAKLEW